MQREALSQFVERIDLTFSECPRGNKMEYRPTTGQIVFRGGSHSFASRGDWPSFEPLITAFVDSVLSPTPESLNATRVVRLSA